MIELAPSPHYAQITVSDDLFLHFDQDDTWIAIKDANAYECDCVMVGLNEVDSLIEKLQEARKMLVQNDQTPNT